MSFFKGVKDPLEAQEGRWDFSRDAALERASSSFQGRISCLFLSCSRKLGVPLELQQGPQGSARGGFKMSRLHASCEGPLEISLQSVPGPRSSSGVELEPQGSSPVPTLMVPLGFPQGSQASSRVESCKSTLLLSWKYSVRLDIRLN